jgi:uncharacterized protein (DUF1330 family)
MPAYILVEITIEDQAVYEEYKTRTPSSIAAYDGKFIVRGGITETLEGDWTPGRIVILEFPTVARAKEWWDSELYAPAKALRQRSASTRMVVVEGIK